MNGDHRQFGGETQSGDIGNDRPAATGFLHDLHRACVGGAFGGVAGLIEERRPSSQTIAKLPVLIDRNVRVVKSGHGWLPRRILSSSPKADIEAVTSRSLIRTGCYSRNCFLSDENSLRIITAIKVHILVRINIGRNPVGTNKLRDRDQINIAGPYREKARVKCASSSCSVPLQRCCWQVLWHGQPQAIPQSKPQLEPHRSTHCR